MTCHGAHGISLRYKYITIDLEIVRYDKSKVLILLIYSDNLFQTSLEYLYDRSFLLHALRSVLGTYKDRITVKRSHCILFRHKEILLHPLNTDKPKSSLISYKCSLVGTLANFLITSLCRSDYKTFIGQVVQYIQKCLSFISGNLKECTHLLKLHRWIVIITDELIHCLFSFIIKIYILIIHICPFSDISLFYNSL